MNRGEMDRAELRNLRTRDGLLHAEVKRLRAENHELSATPYAMRVRENVVLKALVVVYEAEVERLRAELGGLRAYAYSAIGAHDNELDLDGALNLLEELLAKTDAEFDIAALDAGEGS